MWNATFSLNTITKVCACVAGVQISGARLWTDSLIMHSWMNVQDSVWQNKSDISPSTTPANTCHENNPDKSKFSLRKRGEGEKNFFFLFKTCCEVSTVVQAVHSQKDKNYSFREALIKPKLFTRNLRAGKWVRGSLRGHEAISMNRNSVIQLLLATYAALSLHFSKFCKYTSLCYKLCDWIVMKTCKSSLQSCKPVD